MTTTSPTVVVSPRVRKQLLEDEGEEVIDEVHKHWAAMVWPALEFALALPVLLLMAWFPVEASWIPLAVAAFIVAHSSWKLLGVHFDRFVITNMRVFRIHGILSQHIAIMPLARILDITVNKPFVGRIFGFGNFTFESAAQEQGLRVIKFVGDPDERGRTIQRVIQRAGLRGNAR